MSHIQPKQVVSKEQARDHISRAVSLLSDTVGITLGPKGKTVLLSSDRGNIHVTKDGLSVVNNFSLADPVENMVVQTFKEIVKAMPGDGTTTATVLAKSIYMHGLKMIASGFSPAGLKQGIELATRVVVKKLKEMSSPIHNHDSLIHVASVSSNNDKEIGMIIADAFKNVGVDGKITVKEGNSLQMPPPEVKSGFSWDKGYVSGYFVNNPKNNSVSLDAPLVFVFEKKLVSGKQVASVLSTAAQDGKSLLIVAEDIEGEALATLVLNKMRGLVNVCGVRATGFGDNRASMLKDLALYTGAKLVSVECGDNLEQFDPKWLGSADTVIIDKNATLCISGSGDADVISSHTEFLRQQLKEAASKYDAEQCEERIARLTGGVCIIKVGGATEVEIKEKKDRIDDAQHATKEALIHGVLPGGGTAFLRCIEDVKMLLSHEDNDNIRAGIKIILSAIKEPTKMLAFNAGKDGDVIIDKVLSVQDFHFGYNVLSEQLENLLESGIIDPTSVAVGAISNAASCASLLLSTEAIIASVNLKN